MAFLLSVALQLLVVPTLGLDYFPFSVGDTRPKASLLERPLSAIQSEAGEALGTDTSGHVPVSHKLGVMSRSGVTRYSNQEIKQTKRKDGFWWPGNKRGTNDLVGATDLTENVSWGWHHPNGFFNSIPVGSPLIDAFMNIYLGSDDAIRKFDYLGNLIWTYAPRGLLAAAPTLANSTVRRMKDSADHSVDDQQVEDGLKPSRLGGATADAGSEDFHDVSEGDILKVRTGMGYAADGKEFYAAGDLGEITKVSSDGNQHSVHIEWKRTGHQSISSLNALNKRFTRINRAMTTAETNMLVGSTTSGYVFAIDLEKGQELWVTQVCPEMVGIAGVKGEVAVRNGIVVVATNRCLDRYCYRHRDMTNPLWPGNSYVTGLGLSTGTVLWTYKPRSPVWNFLPDFTEEGDVVFFQDWEGSAYALVLSDGSEKWKKHGLMGTFCQGHAIFSPYHNVLFVMLVKQYDEGNGGEAEKVCNAFRTRGIHINCDTWPGRAGLLWALNASSGHKLYESNDLPEPPASGTFGKLDTHIAKHARLVVTFGHNCHYNAKSWLAAFNPDTLTAAWWKEGPTLWSYYCAGDKEGGDIRRAMGQRAKCEPGSWSVPVIDSVGNILVGNQVGQMQLWSASGAYPRTIKLTSSLSTGVAFQDQAIALAPGIMAVSTCTSLIVFHTSSIYDTFKNASWEQDLVPSLPYEIDERPFGVDGPATADAPTQHTDGVYYRPFDTNPPPAL